jgi:hypothetical protein
MDKNLEDRISKLMNSSEAASVANTAPGAAKTDPKKKASYYNNRSNKGYGKNRVTKEQIAAARRVDLLTYMRQKEPNNIRRVKGSHDTYQVISHDSVKISESKGLWFRWSTGKGSNNALDYLVDVENIGFVDAVKMITEDIIIPSDYIPPAAIKPEEKHLELPKPNGNKHMITEYLVNQRAINKNVVDAFISNGLIYESYPHHNVVFVGKNEKGENAYGSIRSIGEGNVYKIDCKGSNKKYSFKWQPTEPNNVLHVFEGAIDLLSFATVFEYKKMDWKKTNLLSLSGIFQSKFDLDHKSLPIALDAYIGNMKECKVVILHLDNDEAGRNATKYISDLLESRGIKVIDYPTPLGKDWNDYVVQTRNSAMQKVAAMTPEELREAAEHEEDDLEI